MGARSTVVVDGARAVEAPERLADALRSLQDGEGLLVDLTRSGEVHAVVLAQLASHLKVRCRSVSIRILGLRHQDCTLLRYLGLEIDSSGCAAVVPRRESDDDRAAD